MYEEEWNMYPICKSIGGPKKVEEEGDNIQLTGVQLDFSRGNNNNNKHNTFTQYTKHFYLFFID